MNREPSGQKRRFWISMQQAMRFPEPEPQRRKHLLEVAKLLRNQPEDTLSESDVLNAARLCFLLAETGQLYAEWGTKYLLNLSFHNYLAQLYNISFHCISAKYKSNPLSQFQTIQEGLRSLEAMQAESPTATETHWVKAQIYSKLPALLPNRPSATPHIRALALRAADWLPQLPGFLAIEVLHFLYTEKALDLIEAKRLYATVKTG